MAALRRPVVACFVLLSLYVVLSLANDPHGYLGTDTGGKVATLRVMAERHRLDPDVGYWAEREDPAGRLHPLYYTSRVGHRWVNVTTLPALYAAYPLYRLGGYRLALLVPMMGAVLAALAGRRLVAMAGGDGDLAFWVLGLGSPLAVYALDFWEHTLGVALLGWAVVAALSARSSRQPLAGWAGAGLLAGLAATMRTEALVYAAALVVALAAVWLLARRPIAAIALASSCFVAGVAVPLLANQALERATVGGSIRAERAAGTAAEAGAGLSRRLDEAATTSIGLGVGDDAGVRVVAAVMVVLAVGTTRRRWPGSDLPLGAVALAGLALLYAGRFSAGLGFVPGMLVASPLATVGAVVGWRSSIGRAVAAVALVALPLIWLFQFPGGAAPQWAGRYMLASGFLLGALALAELRSFWRPGAVGLVVISVAVTGFGVAWLSERSHEVAGAIATVEARPEPVLVSTVAHLAREGGGTYGRRKWLTALTESDLRLAARIVEDRDYRAFALIALAPEQGRYRPPMVPGFTAGRIERVPFLGRPGLVVTAYHLR